MGVNVEFAVLGKPHKHYLILVCSLYRHIGRSAWGNNRICAQLNDPVDNSPRNTTAKQNDFVTRINAVFQAPPHELIHRIVSPDVIETSKEAARIGDCRPMHPTRTTE